MTSRSTRSSRPSPLETPRSARTHSNRSIRHPLRRGREDQFTEIDSQSNHDSTAPAIVPQPEEKERQWVVLIPEKNPELEKNVSPQPTCISFNCASESEKRQVEAEVPIQDRAAFIQSPHLGHREPDHHHRQSVLSYISVGRWSNSTRGGRRRRKYVLGISIGCVVGIILLTGLLAGLLARRSRNQVF